MLFAKSFEFGEHDCLGLVPGRVVPFQIEERVPHIGWNDIEVRKNPPIRRKDGKYVYFVHSGIMPTAFQKKMSLPHRFTDMSLWRP